MEIVLVAAMTEEGVIGKDGDLPWRLPADLKHFKAVTAGHVVLMGRLTFESLDGPLKDRKTIIVTTREDYEVPGCEVASSLEEGLRRGEELAEEALMILGGASVYDQTLSMADRLILTVVHKNYPGDTCFPGIEPGQWELVSRRYREADEKNEAAMTFLELKAIAEEAREVQLPGHGYAPFLKGAQSD